MRGTDPHKQVTKEDTAGGQSHTDRRGGKRDCQHGFLRRMDCLTSRCKAGPGGRNEKHARFPIRILSERGLFPLSQEMPSWVGESACFQGGNVTAQVVVAFGKRSR